MALAIVAVCFAIVLAVIAIADVREQRNHARRQAEIEARSRAGHPTSGLRVFRRHTELYDQDADQ